MTLIEPDVSAARGSFRAAYAVIKTERSITSTLPRLLDHVLSIAEHGDDDYFVNAGGNEFAVVDVVTREKAWFEMPKGCTPDNITAMIESTFDASAFRVGSRLWFV